MTIPANGKQHDAELVSKNRTNPFAPMSIVQSTGINDLILPVDLAYAVTDKQLKIKIVSHLTHKLRGLYGIYPFGSYASEDTRKDSDIDIAILTREKFTPLERWNLQKELASALDKDVDLVDLKNASVILRVEVENGKRIYTGNLYVCESFETTTYALYTDLNETRKDILNDIKNSYGRNSAK